MFFGAATFKEPEKKESGICRDCVHFNCEKKVNCERYNMITQKDLSCKSYSERK